MRPSKTFRGIHFVLLACASGAAAVLACVGDPGVLAPGQPDATPAPVGGGDALPPTPGEDAGDAGHPGNAGDPEDAGDASSADTGVDAAKTHCELTVAPPGATDFLCADFDGTGFGPWTQQVLDDGGSLAKITTAAVSLPNALDTRARSTFGGGALYWKPVSAKNFIEATAHLQINPTSLGGVVPPTGGDVDLIDIRTTTTSVTFGITRGGGGETNPYSGYFVKMAAFGGAAVLVPKNVNTPLTPNVWTDVKLVYAAGTGNVKLLYNNITILDVAGFSANDPTLNFQIGAYATFTNSVPESFRYDDVELSIRR